ncbi:MAG: terminase large subunit [Methylacidiphilales bacterium]|nr:terminase large subunit [Candidatus Methylacidiphilales bacterium]
MADQHPHVDAANGYARDVVAGRVPACKWVKLACQRHLDDLAKSKAKAYPYIFDAEAAEKVCRFVELLPHTKGKWAASGERLKLEPWQSFKTVCLFGWLRKSDGYRRFRKALILEPRKNGKSAWAAAIGLYMLTADGEHGAEVYSGATSERQAWEVFRPARIMALRSPQLCSAVGLTVNASNLHILSTESRFEPIVGRPGDGASPHCAVHDEYHEHDTDDQVSSMETGMGAREQPLQIIITTAGTNVSSPCYAAVVEARRILEGVVEDDEQFALMYGIDPEDDWTTEAALRKANPNFDVSVKADFLLRAQRDAINNARKVSAFKTKHLNEWVQAREAFFNIQRWQESADPEMKIDDFAGQRCVIGLDLASKVDIAAMVILFRRGEGGFACFGKWYLPEKTVELGENQHYQTWATEGRLIVTDGDMIDFGRIRDDIIALSSKFQIDEVACDPWQATMLMTELQAQGVPVVEYRQIVNTMSEPLKEIEALIRSRKIAHDGDPAMTWMLSNVVARADAKDNVYPRKERPENKIDGPVALIMAMGRMIAGNNAGSVYDDFEARPEGLVFV